MTIVIRASNMSGKIRSMELPITESQCYAWSSRQGLIQDIFPQLSSAEREFLITGMTQEEWNELFPPKEFPPEEL